MTEGIDSRCRLPVVLLLLLASSASVACDRPAPEDSPAIASTLTVTPGMTFGADEGEGALTDVFSITPTAEGGLILAEPVLGRVVEFAADGTVVRVVGEKGRGPGEFQVPGFLGWRGDSLAVSDFSRGIHLFDGSRGFAKLITFVVQDPAISFGARPMVLLADGSVAAMGPPSATSILSGEVTHERWLKVSRDGEVLDTLLSIPVADRLYSAEYAGETLTGSHPLASTPMVAAVSDGSSFVIVERSAAATPASAAFRLLRVGPAGDTIAEAAIDYVPRPLDRGQVDSIALELAGPRAERLGAPVTAIADALRDQIHWPDFLPPATSLVVGSDGSTWVRRETVGESRAHWDVFDESFRLAGSVDLPMDLEVLAASFDAIYGVLLDALDVPAVVRYDVSPE